MTAVRCLATVWTLLAAGCAEGGARAEPDAGVAGDDAGDVGDDAGPAASDAGGPADGGESMDGGRADAGTPDAGRPDAGRPDAGRPDAGRPDAGTPDAGTPDAGMADAGTPDAGSALDRAFPTATSRVCSFGACSELGAGGGGRYFRAGDYVEETLTGTGLSSITGLSVSFDMDDYTSGCAVGQPLEWDVKVNGTPVGSYGYVGGAAMLRFTVTDRYAFGAVAGAGAGGDDYTLRYESKSTVCPGGSSWNWFPGGTATLLP